MNQKQENNSHLATKATLSALAQCGLVIIIVLSAWSRSELSWIFLFLGCIVLLNVGRVVCGRSHSRFLGSQDQLWYLVYTGFTLSTALTWGAMAGALIYHQGPGDQLAILVIIVCAGIAAGSTNILTPDKFLARSFVSVLMIPSSIILFTEGFQALGGVGLLYLAFLIAQVNVQCRILDELKSRRLQDIESRRQAEEAIQAREVLALESARTKSQFLANMSHEIRTPLNAIIGITDLLADTGSNELQRKYFRTLKDSGEALLNLVNDILDFSKIDAEKVDLEMIEFNLANAVEGQVNLLSSKAHQKNIGLEIIVDPALPLAVSGDYGRLGQILLNLVSNAIKFTSVGQVTVVLKLLKLTPGEARVRFEVIDTGVGISPESSQILFRPFTQADSSTARKHGGTGLGLSISQKIVQLMKGEIGFESKLSGGTTFWFEIPFPVVDSQTLAEAHNGQNLAARNVDVIVEGLANESALRCYLESWGVVYNFCSLENLGPTLADRVVVVAGIPFNNLINKLKAGGDTATRLIVLENNGDVDHRDSERVQASLSLPLRYSDLFNALNDQASPAIKEMEKPAGAGQFSSYRVLVAEDNSTNQMIILAFLKQFGLQCTTAVNGVETVDAYVQGPYDLILMDCQMPEMDGFEATRRIRSLEKNGQHIPIVALTANALKEDRDLCFASGMDGFLTKPIRKEKLEEALDTFLRVSKV